MLESQLKRKLKQARTYYQFWNENRHLPTAAITADYFSGRIAELESKLNGINKQSNADRQRGPAT